MRGLSGKPKIMWFPGKFWEANTIGEFWSKWNPAIHYGCFLLLRWIRRKVGTKWAIPPIILAIFVIMGLFHDGFVLFFDKKIFPFWTVFFFINGMAIIIEKSIKIAIPVPKSIKKLLTFLWLIGVHFLVSMWFL